MLSMVSHTGAAVQGPRELVRDMMSSSSSLLRPGPTCVCLPVPCTWALNWTWEEIGDRVTHWGDVEVQRQFAWGKRLNTYPVEWDVGLRALPCIKVNGLWAQWLAVTNHNCWSSCAYKAMPFMRQLT